MFKVMKPLLLTTTIITMVTTLAGCGASQSAQNKNSSAGNPSGTTTSASQTNKPRIMTDAMGHKVQIPAIPKRVLAPGLEDELVTLGIKPVAQAAIGTKVVSALQPWLKNVPKINALSYSMENFLQYNPDLIILNSPGFVGGIGKYKQFTAIAPTYVLKDGGQNWRKDLLTMGQMFHKTKAAKQSIQKYDHEAKVASAKIHKAIGNQKVVILVASGKTLSVVTHDWFSGQVLYEDLGLAHPKIVNNSGGNGFPTISLESIPGLHANYIFLVTYNTSAKWLTDSPYWRSLPAVKNGHSYTVSYDRWMQTGGPIADTQTIKDALNDLTKK